ncbi:MAG: hypothetical protein CMF76_10200 [Maricaulis sp.]|nr:hypothetical protein [Maricaulis sp.]
MSGFSRPRHSRRRAYDVARRLLEPASDYVNRRNPPGGRTANPNHNYIRCSFRDNVSGLNVEMQCGVLPAANEDEREAFLSIFRDELLARGDERLLASVDDEDDGDEINSEDYE